MNIERLEIIAEWLEAGAPHVDGTYGFNMDTFLVSSHEDYAGEHCGTAMCIGGAAVQFFGSVEDFKTESEGVDLLGLTKVQGTMLFYPDALNEHFEEQHLGWDSIKPQDAAKVIRHLIDTGEVDWEIILDD